MSEQEEGAKEDVAVVDDEFSNRITIQLKKMEKLPPTWIPKPPQTAEEHIFEYIVGVKFPWEEKVHEIRGGRFYFASKEDESGLEVEENEQASLATSNGVIVWEEGETILMGRESLENLENMISQGRNISGSLRRVIREDIFKEGWFDDNEKKYQGSFEFEVSGLLEPGIRTKQSVNRVYPLKEQEDSEDADKKKPKSREKKRVQNKKNPIPEILFGEPEEEIHPYDKQETVITVIVELDSAIIPLPKDRIRTNMVKLTDIIPLRKRVEKKVDAVEKFKQEIGYSLELLVKQYAGIEKCDGMVDEEQFMFQLNQSGMYFSLRETLKEKIIQIMKERFSKEIEGFDKNQLETFYNDFYMFLIQHMHQTINNIFNDIKKDDPSIGMDGESTDKWKKLADEAEVAYDYALASKYYKQRVGSDIENLSIWYDYATFCFRAGDLDSAERALKELISMDMSNVNALQAFGVLLLCKDKVEEAEVFFQSSVDIDENNYLSWGLLMLYFMVVEKDKAIHDCWLHATKSYQKCQEQDSSNGGTSIRIAISEYLLSLHAHKLAEKLLLEESNSQSPSDQVFLSFAKLYFIREDFIRAEENVQRFLSQHYKSAEAWTLMGNIHLVQNRTSDAEKAYETAVSVSKELKDAVLFLRLGRVYETQSKFEEAKTSFLQAAKIWPCGTSWMGVGVAYYRLGDVVHAEQALNEANVQDNLNPKIWAYLSLICAESDRVEEATKCFREAKRLRLSDKDLISEVCEKLESKGKSGDMLKVLL